MRNFEIFNRLKGRQLKKAEGDFCVFLLLKSGQNCHFSTLACILFLEAHAPGPLRWPALWPCTAVCMSFRMFLHNMDILHKAKWTVTTEFVSCPFCLVHN